jgi:hypothetical protein
MYPACIILSLQSFIRYPLNPLFDRVFVRLDIFRQHTLDAPRSPTKEGAIPQLFDNQLKCILVCRFDKTSVFHEMMENEAQMQNIQCLRHIELQQAFK